MLSIEKAVGRVLMVGFEGDPAPVCDALKAGRVGGVILFARNVQSAEQVTALVNRLRDAAGWYVPIGIDQEGGRVARLDAAGLTRGPSARELAAPGDPEVAYKWGIETGTFLKMLGINLDFAPILDVDSNPDNPIIGDRAWGTTPEAVVRFARRAAEGLHEAGVISCGKHFPGHGDTHLDSHLDLPYVEHGADRLERMELAPFAALAGELPALMTAHVVYPAWHPEVPATLSHTIVTGILKERLGFSGVVFSDDLEMKAVADRYPPAECALLALVAGCDMLLVCKERDRWEKIYDGLVASANMNTGLEERVRDAAQRVARVFGAPK